MAKGINKALIIGRIGLDPKITTLQNGSKIVNISLATDESYTDKTTGQVVKKTEWHKVVFFNKLADIAAQYLKKGSLIYIEGSLRTRKYEKQGVEHYVTEIITRTMQMLDSKSDSTVIERKSYTHPIEKSQENRAVIPPTHATHIENNTPEDNIPF